ncbi:hypothetical protein BDA96_02G092300 [Sorghum bicolor]|uniref:Uncharacterized protein n=1 Tax=Sorghum bicolor TaxID=4558 RepID=A0A921US83_SORBI|nr:hypothetical protein BDA96_02G092300 [Sorghum bicolor]
MSYPGGFEKDELSPRRPILSYLLYYHQSGTSSNHVGGSKASRAGPSPPGPLPGSHIGASQPSPASHSGLSP